MQSALPFSSLPTAPSSSLTISCAWLHSSACERHVSLGQPWPSSAQTCPSILPSAASLLPRCACVQPDSGDDASDRSLFWPGSPWVDDLDVQAGTRVPPGLQLHSRYG